MVLHFLGLALGLSTGFANMVMAGLIAKAAPQDKAVLGRFPPAMAKVGAIGLALLWISGISIVMTRYGSFAILPRPFIVKLIAGGNRARMAFSLGAALAMRPAITMFANPVDRPRARPRK